MKNKNKRRLSRRFRRFNPVFVCICIIFTVSVFLLTFFLITKFGPGAQAACGVEGHCKGDGLNHKALKVSCGNGHHFICECDIWMVPEGGAYYTGVTAYSLGDYSGAKNIYESGDCFLCGSKPQVGDVFVFGDYEYRYGYRYYYSDWFSVLEQRGWGVRVLNDSQTSYGPILDSVCNGDVVSLYRTFAGCYDLEETPVIPASVTDMNSTFQYCTSLTCAPTLPSNVKDLASCFDGCVLLAEPPLIPLGVTALVRTFQNCESLKYAPMLPQSVVDLSSAFCGCKSLTEAPDLPGSLLNMAGTFEGCSSLATTPEIPITVSIMDYTFAGCKKLVDPPVIPSNVKSLIGTFSGCGFLSSAPTIPVEVTNLRETFRDCASIKSAPKIPYAVTDMTSTFEGCISLKGYISVFANPKEFDRCLYRTQINEILGSTQLKKAILNTART